MSAPDFRAICAALREHPMTSRWQRVTDIPETERGAAIALILVGAISPGASICFGGDQLARIASIGANNYAANREEFDRMTMLEVGEFAQEIAAETVIALAANHPDILAAVVHAPQADWRPS